MLNVWMVNSSLAEYDYKPKKNGCVEKAEQFFFDGENGNQGQAHAIKSFVSVIAIL